MLIVCVFCFFKQKTAYEMRISDWSSDVCSSDLEGTSLAKHGQALAEADFQLSRSKAPCIGDDLYIDIVADMLTRSQSGSTTGGFVRSQYLEADRKSVV